MHVAIFIFLQKLADQQAAFKKVKFKRYTDKEKW